MLMLWVMVGINLAALLWWLRPTLMLPKHWQPDAKGMTVLPEPVQQYIERLRKQLVCAHPGMYCEDDIGPNGEPRQRQWLCTACGKPLAANETRDRPERVYLYGRWYELNEHDLARQLSTRTHGNDHGAWTEEWLPTVKNINRLPKPIRDYIHDLETRCDPAGMVQEIASLQSQRDQLLELYRDDTLPRTTRWEVYRILRAVMLDLQTAWHRIDPAGRAALWNNSYDRFLAHHLAHSGFLKPAIERAETP